jgi:hypothetical protein
MKHALPSNHLRTLMWLSLIGSAAFHITSCSGTVALTLGETLCNTDMPCPDGNLCVKGVCIPGDDNSTDTVLTGAEIPPPDEWVEPGAGTPTPVDDADGDGIPDGESCRVDSQCDAGEICLNGLCEVDPCGGVQCDDGQRCARRCRPLPNACDGVECAVNEVGEKLEICVAGDCQPACIADPCDQGCLLGDDCVKNPGDIYGVCANGTTCLKGKCEKAAQTLPAAGTNASNPPYGCGGDFCDAGTECVVECITSNACDRSPCAIGWTCASGACSESAFTSQSTCLNNDGVWNTGPNDYICAEQPCAGVNCAPGERCLQGICVAECASADCSSGGLAGCGDNQVCCNFGCCPSHYDCQGTVCVPPDLQCTDTCENDELCYPASDTPDDNACSCTLYNTEGTIEDFSLCSRIECCTGAGCSDPCVVSSGASSCGDLGECFSDCLDANLGGAADQDYQCVNNCYPSDDGTPTPTTCNYTETTPCTPEQTCLDTLGAGSGTTCVNGFCVTACPADYSCQSDGFCALNCGAVQANNPDCYPPADDGSASQCRCDNGTDDWLQCTASQCCVGQECITPCTATICGDAGECDQDCSGADNDGNYYTCDNHCWPEDTVTACNGNTPCTTGYACEDGQCVKDCKGSSFGANPNCYPPAQDEADGSGAGAAQCQCENRSDPNNPSYEVCGGRQGDGTTGTCCSKAGLGCESPCDPNPCGDTGVCYVDCTAEEGQGEGVGNGYRCDDKCPPNPMCTDANPDCYPVTGLCACDNGSDTTDWPACPENSENCCVAAAASGTGNECVTPCDPDTCGDTGDCQLDCTQTDGDANHFSCVDLCVTGLTDCSTQNNNQNPDCFPPTGDCLCDNGASDGTPWPPCGGSNCCLDDSTGSGNRVCADPCDPDTCGDTGTCVQDCTKALGRRCENACNGNEGCDSIAPFNNPDCYPLSGACLCNDGQNNGDGPWDECTANEKCCVSSECKIYCDPNNNPCEGALLGECLTDCNQQNPYNSNLDEPALEYHQCRNNCWQPDGDGDPKPTACGGVGDPLCDTDAGYRCESGFCMRDCYTETGNQNPDCYPVDGVCGCIPSDPDALDGDSPWPVCGAGECCLGGGCDKPCQDNPCGDDGVCEVDCSVDGGYVCVNSCFQPLPASLNPALGVGVGVCDGVDDCANVNGADVCDPLSERCEDGCSADTDCGDTTKFGCVGGVCQKFCDSGRCEIGGIVTPNHNPTTCDSALGTWEQENCSIPGYYTQSTCEVGGGGTWTAPTRSDGETVVACENDEVCVRNICQRGCPNGDECATDFGCSGGVCIKNCVGNTFDAAGLDNNPHCYPITGDCRCGDDGNDDGDQPGAANWNQCPADQCCDGSGTCDDPCVDSTGRNPCGDGGACTQDCTEDGSDVTPYYFCTNLCDGMGGLACGTQPNPDCYPVTNECLCNDDSEDGVTDWPDCTDSPNQCCNAEDPTINCFTPCTVNPCNDDGVCVEDCTATDYRFCVDLCLEHPAGVDGGTCPNDCNSGYKCVAGTCEPTDSGGIDCTTNPGLCGPSFECVNNLCTTDCAHVNNDPGTLANNPECFPLTGVCGCRDATNDGNVNPWEVCEAWECCTGTTCDDPCVDVNGDSPCEDEGGCVPDCGNSGDETDVPSTVGYDCVDYCADGAPACGGTQPNPDCYPVIDDTTCRCNDGSDDGGDPSIANGGTTNDPWLPCATDGTQCCNSDGTVAGYANGCVTPCAGGAAHACVTGHLGVCEEDCSDTTMVGGDDGNLYDCQNQCTQETGAPTACPNGNECAADFSCTNQVCVENCGVDGDCTEGAGYLCQGGSGVAASGTGLCVKDCTSVTFAAGNSGQNPNCDPADGSCMCHNTTADTWDLCAGSTCCIASLGCVDPCASNGGSATCAGDNKDCVIDCAQTDGYRCVDWCVDDAVTDLPCSDTAAANPDCDPTRNPATFASGGDPDNDRCRCEGPAGTWNDCSWDGVAGTAGTCCKADGTGCYDPCSAHQCADSGTCEVRCGQDFTTVNGVVVTDYHCIDQCNPLSPTCEDDSPNPDCYPSVTGGGTDSCQCKVADTGANADGTWDVCLTDGTQCCNKGGTGVGCTTPCSPDLCADPNQPKCIEDCSQGPGYECVDKCNPGRACPGGNEDCTSDTTGRAGAGYKCTLGFCEKDCAVESTATRSNPDCLNKTTAACSCGNDGNVCAEGSCCVSGTCDADPCSTNPCGDGGSCINDCTKAIGYTCANNCTDTPIDCSALLNNPTCYPPLDPGGDAAARCRCNYNTSASWAQCGASQCCFDSTTTGCDDPCTGPNECLDNSGTVDHCERDCEEIANGVDPEGDGLGFDCTDACLTTNNDGTCAQPNPDCISNDTGGCDCDPAGNGGAACAGLLPCCLATGCDQDVCFNEGTGKPACGDTGTCGQNCAAANGLGFECTPQTCEDGCNEANNPDCNLAVGACGCDDNSADGDAFPVCGASECCVGASCQDPCASHLCADSGACVPDCGATNTVAGQPVNNYRCADICPGTSTGDPVNDPSCTQPNPDCYPAAVASAPPGERCQCKLDDGGDGTWDSCAGAGACCLDGTCDLPCDGNPCLSANPGAAEKCVEDCSESGAATPDTTHGYDCVDQCNVQAACTQPTPDCVDHIGGGCTCNGGVCVGSEACCLNSGCNTNTCSGVDCGDLGICQKNCSDLVNGYDCEDQCDVSAPTCTDANPDCHPSLPISSSDTERCQCDNGTNDWDSCSGPTGDGTTGQCCTGDGNGCFNPCSTSPCAGEATDKKCTVDCSNAQGYTCSNGCVGAPACTVNNAPTCDSSTGLCNCGGFGGNECAASACCVSGACVEDPCASNPCAGNVTDKKCTKDCSSDDGYICTDACLTAGPGSGVCSGPEPNCISNATGGCECNPTGSSGVACGSPSICCAASSAWLTPFNGGTARGYYPNQTLPSTACVTVCDAAACQGFCLGRGYGSGGSCTALVDSCAEECVCEGGCIGACGG